MLLFHEIFPLTGQAWSDKGVLLWPWCGVLYVLCFYVYFFLSFPHKHIRAAKEQIEALNTEISETEQKVKEVDGQNHSLRVKTKVVMQELDALQAQVEASQAEYRQLLKEQEVNREEEAEFIGNRYKTLTAVRNSHWPAFKYVIQLKQLFWT